MGAAATAIGMLPTAAHAPPHGMVFDPPYLLLVTSTATGDPGELVPRQGRQGRGQLTVLPSDAYPRGCSGAGACFSDAWKAAKAVFQPNAWRAIPLDPSG